MEQIREELNVLINENSFLVITGTTVTNGICVNVSHVKDFVKKSIGKPKYRKYKDIIIEEVEKLRDRIYSMCRYLKKLKSKDNYESLEHLINRTKRSSRVELGDWIVGIRKWDTLGCLTFNDPTITENMCEEFVVLLCNYLKSKKLISDFFYCVEHSSHYHINFYCRTIDGIAPNRLRQTIKLFWKNNFGYAWVRKYYKNKESKTYWVKDVNSGKLNLTNSCWDFLYDLGE
ncbi:MAG: hypothetical protein EOO87_17570 [Pedobacter sp.]|nr:MAG: hypothetical protein EOO87_17570 [Pedobacter sp.]